RQHLLQSFIELLGSAKIMERKDQSRAGTHLLQLLGLAFTGGLQFDIYQLATRGSGFVEDVHLRSDRAPELAAADGSPAGRNGYRAGMSFQKALELRNRQARLG